MSDIEKRFARSQLHRGLCAPGEGGDPDRFDCMVETNPWTPESEALRAMLYRGVIVSAWGYIETNLNDVSIRCSGLPDYQPLRAKYPKFLKDRTGFLLRVLEVPGPLQPYRALGVPFIERFMASAALRNTMAHARMSVAPHWGVTFFEIGHFEGQLLRRQTRHQLHDLVAMARTATRLSRICQKLVDGINSRGLLPQA